MSVLYLFTLDDAMEWYMMVSFQKYTMHFIDESRAKKRKHSWSMKKICIKIYIKVGGLCSVYIA